MIVILSKKNSPTADLLREEGNFGDNSYSVDSATVVRWGYTGSPHSTERTINKEEAISAASDKLGCREKLREAGISVPPNDETSYPVVGRPAKHSKGRKFYVCNSDDEVREAKEKGAVYFQPLLPKTEELRVHVADDKTLLVSEKVGDKTQTVWNKSHSFGFRHMHRHEWRNSDKYMAAVRMAKKAVKVMGLDFGAVDVILTEDNYYVLEINTAPALSPLARSKYIEWIKGL